MGEAFSMAGSQMTSSRYPPILFIATRPGERRHSVQNISLEEPRLHSVSLFGPHGASSPWKAAKLFGKRTPVTLRFLSLAWAIDQCSLLQWPCCLLFKFVQLDTAPQGGIQCEMSLPLIVEELGWCLLPAEALGRVLPEMAPHPLRRPPCPEAPAMVSENHMGLTRL